MRTTTLEDRHQENSIVLNNSNEDPWEFYLVSENSLCGSSSLCASTIHQRSASIHDEKASFGRGGIPVVLMTSAFTDELFLWFKNVPAHVM